MSDADFNRSKPARIFNFYHNFSMSLRRRLLSNSPPPGQVPLNLVVSTGGVATTFLMIYLSKFVELNSAGDDDGYKHIAKPLGRRSGKTLFIHGNSEEIYNSIRRRKWLRYHGAKLGCILCLFSWGDLRKKFFIASIKRQVLAFKAAANHDPELNLVIEYDELWDKKEEIKKFFEIMEDRFIHEFPARKQRTSSALTANSQQLPASSSTRPKR